MLKGLRITTSCRSLNRRGAQNDDAAALDELAPLSGRKRTPCRHFMIGGARPAAAARRAVFAFLRVFFRMSCRSRALDAPGRDGVRPVRFSRQDLMPEARVGPLRA